MEVPPKVKRRITTHMPQRIQGKNQKRDSYTQVHSSTKVEATQRLSTGELTKCGPYLWKFQKIIQHLKEGDFDSSHNINDLE